MAYLAFYRAFRPTGFDGVVRQEHIVKILKNQIAENKVGHAYLFCGPRGTGKTSVAKIFARSINCENPVNGSPCGVCPTCRALAEGSNLDISEIDAASNNGVDEMRDLREKVQYPPVAGKYKVYIIDEVHMLTQSAFNAVLKTLEEPPRHAVFILATTEPQKIPATILSRCMRFDFKLLPKSDLENLIKSVFDKIGKGYEEEAVSAIAAAGAGSARDSLSIADMCASYSTGKLTYNDVNAVLGSADFTEIAEIAQNVFNQNAPLALSSVEKVLSTGKGAGVLVKDLLSFLNNCAIVKMCANAKEILNLPEDRFSALKGAADIADGHKILRVTEIIAKAEGDMRYALNGRITLETAILKCAMPDTDYDIDALIGRVALLEKQVKEGAAGQSSPRPVPDFGVPPVQAKPVAQSVAPSLSSNSRADAPSVRVSEPRSFAPPSLKPLTGASADVNPFAADETAIGAEKDKNPFSSPQSAQKTEQPAQKAENSNYAQAEQPALWEQATISPASAGSLSEADKKQIFGRFLRLFRTTRRNAVLFTLCMDLESAFEGDKFVLTTTTEAVYKALTREENDKFISEALAELGVFSHEIRLKAKGEDKYESALKQLRENFKGTDIEIK